MFFVLTRRVVRHNTGSTQQYAPRYNNVVTYNLDGPFTKRAIAERAATAALSNHTCLGAQVLTPEQIEGILDLSSSMDQTDYTMIRMLQTARKYLVANEPPVKFGSHFCSDLTPEDACKQLKPGMVFTCDEEGCQEDVIALTYDDAACCFIADAINAYLKTMKGQKEYKDVQAEIEKRRST